MSTLRLHRLAKRLLVLAAALPLCQMTTSCADIATALGQNIVQQTAFSIFSTFVGATQGFLASYFPSADLLQIFLGGNRFPFFRF